MAAVNMQPEPPRKTLGRDERFWGYVFIAAPLIGFLIFTALPLFGSLALSMTEWDLLTDPEWVSTANWEKLLSLKIVEHPPELDEATGEPVYRCGREKVIESQVEEYEGQIDPITRENYVCEPRMIPANRILPRGYKEAFTFGFMGNDYLIGAQDEIFWKSLYNTFFLLFGIPISLAIAIGLAVALNQGITGTRFYRTFYYMPTILPIAALVLIWMWIFNPDYGLLNYVLRELGFSSLARTNWLQNKDTIKPALIIVTIWKGVGYQMIIYVAGLQGIPRQLYEAAEIDGAGPWARFRHITWPGLTPTTFFLLITSMIAYLQIFQEPWFMSNGSGGPEFSSITSVMLIWQNAFRDLQMGYAAAQAWMLGAIIMLLTFVNFMLAKRWVFYE